MLSSDCRCCCTHATAPAPVSASMRRTPAATPLSSVDDERADVAGGADVRAAAELHAEAGNRDDADAVAVLLAEERHRAVRDRLLGRLDLGRHRRVADDLLVDDALDAQELVARDGGDVHEVEAQPVGRDERARLLDVRAEHLPQRRMEQVRRRVIAARRVADLVGDLGGDDLSAPERARTRRATRCSRGRAWLGLARRSTDGDASRRRRECVRCPRPGRRTRGRTACARARRSPSRPRRARRSTRRSRRTARRSVVPWTVVGVVALELIAGLVERALEVGVHGQR